MDIKKIDIDKVAAAIEADAGESLPDLRQALAEAKAGLGRVSPSKFLCGKPREKSGPHANGVCRTHRNASGNLA